MSSIATSPRAGRVLTMRAGGRPTGSGRHDTSAPRQFPESMVVERTY